MNSDTRSTPPAERERTRFHWRTGLVLAMVNGLLAGVQTRYFSTGSVTAMLVAAVVAALATVLGLALSK